MTTSVRFGNSTVQMGVVPLTNTTPPPRARAFLVGRAARGPVNVPTVVRDLTDYEARFGIGTEANGGLDAYTAAAQYFRDASDFDLVMLRLTEGTVAVAKEAVAGSAKLQAVAVGPGTDYHAYQVAYVKTGATYTFYYRRMVNGRPSPARSVPNIALTGAGVLAANIALSDAPVQLVFDPQATTDVIKVSTDAANLDFTALSGGQDSAAITATTLAGEVDPDTRVRTGLTTLEASEYGGGVIIAPGMNTDDHRAALMAFAERTARFAPIEPQGEVFPSAAVTDLISLQGKDGAAFAAYYYGRGRNARSVYAAPVSALGHIAALFVNSVMRRPGFIAPPAGPIGLPDVQRGPDGRTMLVDNDNYAELVEQGLNVLLIRDGRVEVQGLQLIAADPDQPATDKVHERLLLNAIIYDVGPALRRFDNAWVDARGGFESAVRERISERVRPYWQSNCLYGSREQDAYRVEFSYTRKANSNGRARYQVGVNLKVKISEVSEGVSVNLYHLDITTPFSF